MKTIVVLKEEMKTFKETLKEIQGIKNTFNKATSGPPQTIPNPHYPPCHHVPAPNSSRGPLFHWPEEKK